MQKFARTFFLFTLFLLVFSTLISLGMDKLLAGKLISYRKHTWVITMKERSYDYGVLGSSRVYNMVNVPLMDSILHTNGINMATSGSSYGDNYCLLLKFLENGNKLKKLFLNIDEYCFDTQHHYSYPFADYEYMPFFFQKNMREVYSDYESPSKMALWTVVPFSRYAEFSDKYKLRNFFILRHFQSDYENSKGGEMLTDSTYKNFKASFSTLNVNDTDVKYLYKICALCKQKGIPVIFLTTPESPELYPLQKNRAELYNRIYQWTGQLGEHYYMFDKLADFSDRKYFRDYTHTNSVGSAFYSKLLAAKLREDKVL